MIPKPSTGPDSEDALLDRLLPEAMLEGRAEARLQYRGFIRAILDVAVRLAKEEEAAEAGRSGAEVHVSL